MGADLDHIDAGGQGLVADVAAGNVEELDGLAVGAFHHDAAANDADDDGGTVVHTADANAVGDEVGDDGHILGHGEGERVIGDKILVAGGDAPAFEAVAAGGGGQDHGILPAVGLGEHLDRAHGLVGGADIEGVHHLFAEVLKAGPACGVGLLAAAGDVDGGGARHAVESRQPQPQPRRCGGLGVDVRQACAAHEGRGFNRVHPGREVDAGQRLAEGEDPSLDGGDALGDGDAVEAGAVVEGGVANRGDALGDVDGGQIPAEEEGFVADGGEALGEGDADQFVVLCEGTLADGRDRRGNGDHAVAAEVEVEGGEGRVGIDEVAVRHAVHAVGSPV